MTYQIISVPHSHNYQIKRSQFIAFACQVKDRGQALFVLQQQKERFTDARHHCWAYLIGSPTQPSAMAMSDDGEPSGTAGKPMLNVLQHGEIGDVMVVISRYFGGIKLGAGGLVRAYSHATQLVLNEATTTEQIPTITCKVYCEFSQEQYLRHILSQLHAEVLDNIYTNQVALHLLIPNSRLKELKNSCKTNQFNLEIDIQ